MGRGVKLGDYYREFGESDHLAAVEAVLTDEPQTTIEIAEAASVSANYARAALEYLHEERRVQRRRAPLEKPIRGQWWRWEWRRPPASARPDCVPARRDALTPHEQANSAQRVPVRPTSQPHTARKSASRVPPSLERDAVDGRTRRAAIENAVRR